MRGALSALGVGRGDRVALLCPNGRFFVVTYLATLGLGAVAVPLNPTSPALELERELATVEAKVVAVHPTAHTAWNKVDRARVPTVTDVIAADGGIPGAHQFSNMVQAAPTDIVEVEPDTLAALMFTSGTAGAPRAAMLSHGNLRSNIDQGRAEKGRIRADDVVYGVLPLFHIFGLNVVLGLSLAHGATVVLVQRFDPSTALETIRERSVTVLPGA